MIVAFEKREAFELDLKSMSTAKNIQNMILKGVKSDGGIFRVDFGRVCYTKREEDLHSYFDSSNQYTVARVDVSSLSKDRIQWISRYLEYLSKKNLRNESIRSTLYQVKQFFNYCDFEGTQPTTFDDLIVNYQSYQLVLLQKVRSAIYSASTVYKLLRVNREFIQIAFNLSDAEILAFIPKPRHRETTLKTRDSSLDDLEKYIQTCILCFNHFADSVLENRYPVQVKLLDSDDEFLYWHAPSIQELKSIPNCLDKAGNLAAFSDIEKALSCYFESDRARKDFYRHSLVRNREKWMNDSFCPRKIYAYNFSVYCFFRIYVAFTAANVQPSLDLKISDLDVSKIGSGSFAKIYKHRAGKKVHFTSSSYLKRLLLKYLKLRSWVNDQEYAQDQEVDDYLFVGISERKKMIRLLQNAGWSTMTNSLFFKRIKPISLREIRGLAGEYVIKQSKGKLSLVAKKLNNTITTVAKSYTSIDLESQAIEMNEFHEGVSLKIQQFNRDTCDIIPINIVEENHVSGKVERIATGSCSNLSSVDPIRATGFNKNAPDPECGTFESCLFCKFFSLHLDFEDIHKLLSLKEALLKTSIIRNDPEHFNVAVEPSIYRISEIVENLQNQKPDTKNLVDDVKNTIEMGIYNDNWTKQIMMLEKVIKESNEELA